MKFLRCRRFFCLLLFCLSPGIGQAEPLLRVFVSVLPQKTLVERVGGRHVQVTALVRPGYSPATYNPTPRQIAALGEADVYVLAGVPFEDAWTPRIMAVNPDIVVLDSRVSADSGHGALHAHGRAGDPHAWTSPILALAMAARIRDGLARLLPEQRQSLEAGYTALATDLAALDDEIRSLLDPIRDRRFLVYHPAWGHFADAYGLTQLSIEQDGKDPGARTLAGLIEEVREAQIKVVFVQPQFHSNTALRVAERIGGRLEEVDPLAPQIGSSLRRLARLIAQDRS